METAYFAEVTSVTITWNSVNTLLRLLSISNRSRFDHYPTGCMFSFENGPNIEAVPNASEFLRSTHTIWDNDRAIIYCIRRRIDASPWLHNGDEDILWVFIK
jgi:hypothetical protein